MENKKAFELNMFKGMQSPFEGKTFKVITYDSITKEELDSETVEITNQIQFNTVLEEIGQFNNECENRYNKRLV